MRELVSAYLRERVRRGEITVATSRNLGTALYSFAEVVGRKPVGRLSKRDVQKWMEVVGHLAPGTRCNQFSYVRMFCAWLRERNYVKRDVFAGLTAPRRPRSVPRALAFDAVQSALAACPDLRARLITVLMVQQGLRCVEVARLEVGDVDMANRTMTVVGKGGHQRILWITDEAMEELRAYMGKFPSTSGPLIRNYRRPGEGISAHYVSILIGRVMKDAGIKHLPRDGVSAHALRHTAATDMLRAGAHLRDVQQALGHRHLATTETYLPLLVNSLEQAMDGRHYLAVG